MVKYTPVIIIGAGRSGTNMLRNILTQIPGFGTWPCDEINYIWRHGNARYPSDEFTADMASARIKRYIRSKFYGFARSQSLSHLVEKTCANSLRIPFVYEIFPEAKYINIIRDGRDVAISAADRWTAKLDIPYILKKARYVPVSDIFYYAVKYLFNRIYRLFSNQARLSSWGPRYEGMDKIVKEKPLLSACALQWERSMHNTSIALKKIAPDRYFQIRYEEFVSKPEAGMKNLLEFLGIELSNNDISKLTDNISPKSAGRWKTQLKEEEIKMIENEIYSTLKLFEYIE